MPYANEKRIQLAVDTSTSGNNELISAPGDGSYLAIDFLLINPNGGGQTLTIVTGSTTIFSLTLDDNQPFTIENAIHDPEGIIKCGNNEAFVLNLGAGTQVTGYIKYRVFNN